MRISLGYIEFMFLNVSVVFEQCLKGGETEPFSPHGQLAMHPSQPIYSMKGDAERANKFSC
jgi:hypothetical protein